MLESISVDDPESRAHIATLQAIILKRFGDRSEAAVAARRACAIADTYGLKTPFLLIPEDDRGMFGESATWDSAFNAAAARPRLTERERVVLAELLGTSSVHEIATHLNVSVNTVRSQRRTLYRKLAVTSREEALAVAVTHDLLSGSRA